MRNKIKECEKLGHLNLLYEITKIVAESDSIGEGYGYCSNYTRERFDKDIKTIIDTGGYDIGYISCAGLPIYETVRDFYVSKYSI